MHARQLAKGAASGAAGVAVVAVARAAAGGERALSRGVFQPPPPAQLAGRLLNRLTHRRLTHRRAARRHAALLNVAMHVLYAPAPGVAYALARRRAPAAAAASALFAAVWATRLAILPGLGLRKPFWRYSPRENAIDAGYHAAYAFGVAATDALIRRAERR